jgi:hypothetical protein
MAGCGQRKCKRQPGVGPADGGRFAFAINASGQVTGHGYNGTAGQTISSIQAFVGTTSGSTPIPLPSGWTYTFGLAINDSGQVAGWGDNADAANQAFGRPEGRENS